MDKKNTSSIHADKRKFYMNIRFASNKFNYMTKPIQKLTQTFGSRKFLGRTIYSFLITTIMSPLWDFKNFHKKPDSIFNSLCLHSKS